MRLYVKDEETNKKIYLDYKAENRKEILKKIGSKRIQIKDKKYFIKDIQADAEDTIATTTAIGGVIGLLGGVPGLILGSIIGGVLASQSDKDDKIKAINFNKSAI